MDGGSQWRPLGPHLINKEIFPGYNIGYNCRKIMGSLDQWDGNIFSDVSSRLGSPSVSSVIDIRNNDQSLPARFSEVSKGAEQMSGLDSWYLFD